MWRSEDRRDEGSCKGKQNIQKVPGGTERHQPSASQVSDLPGDNGGDDESHREHTQG